MTAERLRVHVIGAGAIGSLFAGYLSAVAVIEGAVGT